MMINFILFTRNLEFGISLSFLLLSFFLSFFLSRFFLTIMKPIQKFFCFFKFCFLLHLKIKYF
jgi:hypothetical protein